MPETPQPPDASLEARLKAAEARHSGAGRVAGPKDASPWGVGVRVGVEMLSAMIVGLAIGWGLDRWLHTRPVFLALFMLLGGTAGVVNVWRMFAPRGR